MPSAARPTTWLVTGTSRGIGLEIVRQLVANPSYIVVAALRNPDKAPTLHGLKDTAKGKLHIIQLDVSDFDSIRQSVKQVEPILGNIGLDYLVNNAGVVAHDTAFTLDPEELLSVVRTNTAGPALLSQVLLPFIEKGEKKTILHISSVAGSMQSVPELGVIYGSYSMSKAAYNMLAQKQKIERPDLTIISMCPGHVKTDMNPVHYEIEPEESVQGIIKVITSVKPSDSGKYLRYNGEIIPW
ncbi:NAD-P-binding protein [Trametes coccinea BRFM310]|uniref:NAD-P-binding protein n=1 Tax=Trametes coccinea (strain BRFM310) TaxID=1353009 RepID=A0A1Y2IYC3_TRAC3|nr:NAD-P-binding protein [Trametes coccinea BRFM310]